MLSTHRVNDFDSIKK